MKRVLRVIMYVATILGFVSMAVLALIYLEQLFTYFKKIRLEMVKNWKI